MANDSTHKAAMPNPALQPWARLVGEWHTTATHRLLPTPIHGRTVFEWLEGGAFLKMSSDVDEPGVPSSICIFGSDDRSDVVFMLYFDERGVSRRFEAALQDNVWKLWRNVSGFSQRFSGTISEDGVTINGVWELNEDDTASGWKHDLETVHTRVK